MELIIRMLQKLWEQNISPEKKNMKFTLLYIYGIIWATVMNYNKLHLKLYAKSTVRKNKCLSKEFFIVSNEQKNKMMTISL